MPTNELQAFLNSVYNLAVASCGEEFSRQISDLRRERERLLKNSWKEIAPEDLGTLEQQEIFREIDFDTIILHAARYLEPKEYAGLLYAIADTAVGFGKFDKARRLLTLISSEYDRVIDQLLVGKIHQKLGDIAFYQNDYNTAIDKYGMAEEIYTQQQDLKAQTAIKNSIGIVLTEQGKPDKAEKLFMTAKKQAESEDYESLLVRINMNLGNLYHITGAYDKAMSMYREALSLLGDQGDTLTRARINHNIGIVFKSQKKHFKALENFEQSIELSAAAQDLYQKGLSYLEKAEVMYHEGDLLSGTALATTAFQVFSELGDRLSIADVYKVFGMISTKRKQFDVAMSYFENSMRINQEYHNPLNMGETKVELAKVYANTGDTGKALETLQAALGHFEEAHAEAKIRETRQTLESLKQ